MRRMKYPGTYVPCSTFPVRILLFHGISTLNPAAAATALPSKHAVQLTCVSKSRVLKDCWAQNARSPPPGSHIHASHSSPRQTIHVRRLHSAKRKTVFGMKCTPGQQSGDPPRWVGSQAGPVCICCQHLGYSLYGPNKGATSDFSSSLQRQIRDRVLYSSEWCYRHPLSRRSQVVGCQLVFTWSKNQPHSLVPIVRTRDKVCISTMAQHHQVQQY